MYLIGDRVVHPMHGAGVIENITEERIGGQSCRYYVFRMPVGGLVLKIPTENCAGVGIRSLSAPSEIQCVMDAIPQMKIDMTANWSLRYRENMERLKSGNLMEVAAVIKGLMWRERKRGLSNGERKMLYNAKQILISEIVLVEDSEYDIVEQRINAAMFAEVEG